MTKPLRKIPWCRHYAHLVIYTLSVIIFLLAMLCSISEEQAAEQADLIGKALGYTIPFGGSVMCIIIFFEQLFTRFKAQWKRNMWYYHIAIPTLYILITLFLRKSDLVRSMDNFSEDKLPVAYFFIVLPLILYLYRVFVPFRIVKKLKYAISGKD